MVVPESSRAQRLAMQLADVSDEAKRNTITEDAKFPVKLDTGGVTQAVVILVHGRQSCSCMHTHYSPFSLPASQLHTASSDLQQKHAVVTKQCLTSLVVS